MISSTKQTKSWLKNIYFNKPVVFAKKFNKQLYLQTIKNINNAIKDILNNKKCRHTTLKGGARLSLRIRAKQCEKQQCLAAYDEELDVNLTVVVVRLLGQSNEHGATLLWE